ncbi:hypothetical protein nbrc107696_45950 [Gordonia spumicola]|uniref:DUF7666 domain-containing protein n=1 Tax=Gordonia spumicola TaxID=589161 RepID=A0A7I9VFJ7_9ACTN|nr:hypothetical protein [Gordonia spumicola]GEE00220.1 hypothetical protein nbrc107696_06660 [Gordonia spumicola]GEE04149.1 hypothetical protein nbrc107696_45950 [Gordonia spumicola]
MTIITVTTQQELDKALADKACTIYVESPDGVWLTLNSSGSSHVVAGGSSHVEAGGRSHVEARDSSHVEARDSSHVEARGRSHVEAWDSSHVVAGGRSHVVARGRSHVVAGGSSHVEAWDRSHVEAGGRSHVEARDSSHVEARDSSHVEAWDRSHVEARRCVAIHLHSQRVTLDGGVVIDMTAVDMTDPRTWCEVRGVKVIPGETTADDIAVVFKAVDDKWTTPRGVDYRPGSTPEAPDWEPTTFCGHGLHFGVSPSRSADYLQDATRFVRVGVLLSEMVPLDDKCKAKRVVTACVAVDREGREVTA